MFFKNQIGGVSCSQCGDFIENDIHYDNNGNVLCMLCIKIKNKIKSPLNKTSCNGCDEIIDDKYDTCPYCQTYVNNRIHKKNSVDSNGSISSTESINLSDSGYLEKSKLN